MARTSTSTNIVKKGLNKLLSGFMGCGKKKKGRKKAKKK